MPYTPVQTTGDGSTTAFAVPFIYLDQDHVVVTVDGDEPSYTWLDSSNISISPAPDDGAVIKITRETPLADAVTYTAGRIKSRDLNYGYKQPLRTLEEIDYLSRRSIYVDGTLAPSGSLVFPAASNARVIAWDGDGDLVNVVNNSSSLTLSLGSEDRFLSERLTESYVSLRDFVDPDKEPDGVNDFTTELNAAWAAGGGKPIFIGGAADDIYKFTAASLSTKTIKAFGRARSKFDSDTETYNLDPSTPQFLFGRASSGKRLNIQIFGGLGAGASANPETQEWNLYAGLLAGNAHDDGDENIFFGPWVFVYGTYAQDSIGIGHGAIQHADEIDRIIAIGTNALKQAFSRTPWDHAHDYFALTDLRARRNRVWELVFPGVTDYLYDTGDGGVEPTYGATDTWEAGAYEASDWVVVSNVVYRCVVDHDTTTFAADLASGKWVLGPVTNTAPKITATGRPAALFLPVEGSPGARASSILALCRDAAIHLLRGKDSNFIGYKNGNGLLWVNEVNSIGVSTFGETIRASQVNAIGGQVSANGTLFAETSNLMGWGAARFVPSYRLFNAIGDQVAYYLGWDEENYEPWNVITADPFATAAQFQNDGVIFGASAIYTGISFKESVAVGNFIGRGAAAQVYFADTISGHRALNEAYVPELWEGIVGHRIVSGYYAAETAPGGGYWWVGDSSLRVRALISGDLNNGHIVFGHDPWLDDETSVTHDRAAPYQYAFYNTTNTLVLGIGSNGTSEFYVTDADDPVARFFAIDASADDGPLVDLVRDSGTPAASDVIGSLRFIGYDSTDVETIYARIRGQIIDPTDGSEDGRLIFSTMIAGSNAIRMYLGHGLYTVSQSDMGSNTINAGTLYEAGTSLAAKYQAIDGDLTAIAALTPSNDDIVQRKAGAWTNRTMAQLITDLAALGTTFQPLDSDLTTIAGLTATTDNFLQAKAGAWASRTVAQVKTDLAITKLPSSSAGILAVPNVRYAPVGTTGNTNAAVVANTLYVMPVDIPEDNTFTKISIRVTTLAAGNARLGIYANDRSGGGPGTLIVDCGTVSTGTGGLREVTFSQALTRGTYWMAAVFDATPTVNSANANGGARDANSATSLGIVGYSRAFAYAALPADESAQTYTLQTASGSVPTILIGIN